MANALGGEQHRDALMEQVRVQALGKTMISRLAMLLKTSRLHSVQNSALQFSLKIFVEAANSLSGHLGDFTFRGDVDSVFIDDVRIRLDAILWDNTVLLLSELGRRGVGGIQVTGTMHPLSARKLLQVILDHSDIDARMGPEIMNGALDSHGVMTVRFLPRLQLVAGGGGTPLLKEEKFQATNAIRVYSELLVTWQAYLACEDRTVPEFLRGRMLHAVQAAVDMLHDDPDWFLSTAVLRQPAEYQAVHSVNMCVLALSLGHRIELGRKALMNLGMSALYADSGMRRLGVEATLRPKPGGVAEAEGLAVHPLHSIKEIVQTPALTRAQRDRILVAYEHHIGRDGTGFPEPIAGKPKHLFSSIVSLADRFDSLTSDYDGHTALTRTQALEQLTQEVNLHDRRLLAIFIHLLGPFPIGTVVELSSGEKAVVFRQAPDPRFRTRPLVKIVTDVDGNLVQPVLFDLTMADSDGHFTVHLVRAVSPDSIPNLDPAQVLFTETGAGADADARPRWVPLA